MPSLRRTVACTLTRKALVPFGACCALALLPASAATQRLDDARVAWAGTAIRGSLTQGGGIEASVGGVRDDARADAPYASNLVLALGALTGLAVSVGAGYAAGGDCRGGECYQYVYMLLIEPVLVPVGVNVANRQRGSVGTDLLLSYFSLLGAAAFGSVLVNVAPSTGAALVTGAIALQFVAVIDAEKSTSRRRAANQRP